MAHPLEAVTAAMVAEQVQSRQDLSRVKADLRSAEGREALLEGKLQALTEELNDAKARADHYLRWNVEITRQLHNIGMFVQDALHLARVEVGKGDGNTNVPMERVEKAIEDARSL